MKYGYYFNRGSLINYVMERVSYYNNRTDTNHVAWDFLCDAKKFIDYMICGRPGDEFYIHVRKDGFDSGSEEHCQQCDKILGSPIMVIKIENLPYDHESRMDYRLTEFNLEFNL